MQIENHKEYQKLALRTESYDMDKIKDRLSNEQTIRLLHAAMGLATEASEFLDVLKKHIFYGREIDFVNLAEELGDSEWYGAIATDALGVEMLDLMVTNIKKLKARFPESFNEKDAVERNLEKEREILENGVDSHSN